MVVTPTQMDAWVLRQGKHGAPKNVLLKECVPVPVPKEGEVLVRVMAAGLNFSAVWAALGKPVSPFDWHKEPFHIPGTDGAGVVWKLGPGATKFKVGDAVVLQPNVRCGKCKPCKTPSSEHCERYRVHGYETPNGTFAQYTLVKEYQLLPKPEHVSWEEAGSYMVSLMTAYHMLVDRAGLRGGDDVLVWGAAGGMGVYAVQLCKLVSARAVGIVSSPERAELVKKLGAVGAIDRTEFPDVYNVHRLKGPDRRKGVDAIKVFREKIRSFIDGRDVDVVFEHPGEATFFASVYLAGPSGRIVLSGATTGHDLTFDARYLWLGRKSILGAHSAPLTQVAAANQLIVDRQIEVVLTRTFGFAEVAQANQLMFENKINGNAACVIDAPDLGLKTVPKGWL